jgi:Aromatic acid exporter family member 2/Putative ER transporter, 6TM, N-terminal/Fusaric acid resistance protein-like
VCALLIFPTSSSAVYVGACCKFAAGCLNLSRQNLEILETKSPSSEGFPVYRALGAGTSKLRSALAALEAVAKTIAIEVSIGRMDAGDIGELQSVLTTAIPVIGAFQVYYRAVDERKEMIMNNMEPIRRASTAVPRDKMSGTSKIFTSLHDTYKPVGAFESNVKAEMFKTILMQKDPEDNLTLEDLDLLQETVAQRYSDILKSTNDALQLLGTWLKETNEFRINAYVIPGRYKKCREQQVLLAQQVIETSKSLREQFNILQNNSWEEIYADKFEHNELLLLVITLGSLFGYFVDRYVSTILRFLDLAVDVDARRPTPALITPFTKLIRKKAQFPKDGIDSGRDELQDNFTLRKDIEQRDPDASPPKHIGHLMGRKLLAGLRLLGNKHVVFGAKLALFCILAVAPLFVRTTAKWFYLNRLIWVPIMVSLSAAEFAGDTVYNFLSRLFGTFVAGVIGLVAWYISSGSGSGNAWGFGVVCAVVAFFAAFYRLYSVHQNMAPSILLPVTVFLILGTSWQDGRPNQITDLTNGFEVAWVRFVTVVVGTTIAFICSIIPQPRTARAAVRKILSRVLEESGNVHGAVTQFAIERSQNPSVRIAPRYDVITLNLRTLFRKLAYNLFLFPTMSWEPSLKGVWPKQKYEKLQRLTTEIVQLYFSLYHLIDQFNDPTTHVPLLLARCGFTNPQLQADYFSILHMSSAALMSTRPLPMVTPAHTSILHASCIYEQWGISGNSIDRGFYQKSEEDQDKEDVSKKMRRDWRKQLDMQGLLSHDGRLLVVGIYFAHLLYERVDEVMYVVKGLVGEEFGMDLRLFKELADKEFELTKKMA